MSSVSSRFGPRRAPRPAPTTRPSTVARLAATWLPLVALCPTGGAAQAGAEPARGPGVGWPAYGGDAGGSRYSALARIDRDNVARLEEAWSYRTGELGQGARDGADLTFEATPILFEGTLYLSTAFGVVIALDPATGVERWTHDPGVDRSRSYSEITSRGVAAWRDPEAAPGTPCAARIFLGTIDARLLALDAATGAPCEEFGEGGQADLAREVGMQGNGDYQVTSPPAVVNGVVVVGSSIGDNWSVDTGSGVVRGLEARTGQVRWRWHPIPRGPQGKARVGAANAWSVFSVDAGRDLVFVPTGSPSPDFYGGLRPGDDRWANSVMALRGGTGERVWGFQTVHHDLWDYDVAAQPVLVRVPREKGGVPAVAVATKRGALFVLHRETGEPIFAVEERSTPRSAVPGERAWPTQPWPVAPRPLVPQGLTPEDLTALPPGDRAECLAAIEGARSEGPFTPPSLEGTVLFPGNAGGTNWGSAAWDPARGLLVLNTLRLPTYVQLVPREEFVERRRASEPGYEWGSQRGAPYGMRRRNLLSSRGLPCAPPPWGTLAAVDLATGDVAWEVPLGDGPLGPAAGHLNMGGPIVTAGGLVFIGASLDGRFRAFDVESGEELWSVELPRAAIATPMTYEVDGRQLVVVAAGGHGKAGLETGDWLVAFSLPEDSGPGRTP